MIDAHEIEGREIMFTDEKWFYLFPMLNSSTNKIRVCDDTMRKIKAGDLEKIQMMYRPIPLYSPKVMVSGGVSWNGVSELKFFIGHADTFSYLQCLELYKADLIRLKEPDRVLLFQQDNAKPHTSKITAKFFNENTDYFNVLPWPAHSPDLSPIELLWAIVQERLMETQPTDIEDLKEKLLVIWNAIDVQLCRRLIVQFEKRLKQIVENKGDRYHRILEKKEDKSYKKIICVPDKAWGLSSTRQIAIGENMALVLKNRAEKRLKKKFNITNKFYLELKNRTDSKRIDRMDKKHAKMKDPTLIKLVESQRAKDKIDLENFSRDRIQFKRDFEKCRDMTLKEFVDLIPENERIIIDRESKKILREKKKRESIATTADGSEISDEGEEIGIKGKDEDDEDEDVSEEF